MNIQEKTFGYFTEEDWLEIKEHLLKLGKDAVKEVIKEEGIDLENLIRQIIREELKNL